MSQVRQLYRLQQIDSEISAKKLRLAEVIQMQRETKELQAARVREQKAAANLHNWQSNLKNLNLEQGSVSSEAKNTENRLYSGKVSNPKELADLQHKIEALGRRQSVLDDEILEAMIMVEDCEAEKKAADQQLAEVLTSWEKSQDSLKVEQNELALELNDLIGSRKKQAALIDQKTLNEYEQLKARKGGVAVAGLINNSCGRCHLTVSATKIKRVEQDEMVTCGGCGRILSPV